MRANLLGGLLSIKTCLDSRAAASRRLLGIKTRQIHPVCDFRATVVVADGRYASAPLNLFAPH